MNIRQKRHAARPSRQPAARMLASCKARTKKDGRPFDLTLEWLEAKIAYGRCEQTGIPFSWQKGRGTRNPWAFSIDQIEPGKGYTKANCQAVVWAYNAAKTTGTDADVMRMARALCGLVRSVDA